jgi:hypothetical protein
MWQLVQAKGPRLHHFCALRHVRSSSLSDVAYSTVVVRRVGIILAITIPRVPSFSLNERQALSPATGAFNRSVPTIFSRLPANFSFPAFSVLQVDTTSNYVPITFNSINAQVFDLDSNRRIGTGYMGRKRLPAKSFPVIQVALNFSYVADNDTDATCKSFSRFTLPYINYLTEHLFHRVELVQRLSKSRLVPWRHPSRYVSCSLVSRSPIDVCTSGVRFRLVLDIDIAGLPGRKGSTTQTSNANCPVELPQNSV